LSEGRGHRAGPDRKESGDLTAIEAEVELGDDDPTLSLGQRPQQLVDLDPIQDGAEIVVLLADGEPQLSRKDPAVLPIGPAGVTDGHPEEPPDEIHVISRRSAQTLRERFVDRVQRRIVVAQDSRDRPIHAREFASVEVLPAFVPAHLVK
jgi:hypothetical protein